MIEVLKTALPPRRHPMGRALAAALFSIFLACILGTTALASDVPDTDKGSTKPAATSEEQDNAEADSKPATGTKPAANPDEKVTVYDEDADSDSGKAKPAAEEPSQAAGTPSGNLFPVIVVADGSNRKVMVSGGTVAELLARADIELDKYDEVSKPLDEKVSSGNVITVTRIRYETITIKETLPYETLQVYSPKLNANEEKVLVEGEDGLRERVVRQFIVDGEVKEETLKSDEITKKTVHKEVLIGFPVKPVSTLDFEAAFNEKGEPVEYVNVLRGEKSSAYTASSAARTSTGRSAAIGHVAVNPNVIPYGSKLFIRSADGKFVYGYAIAADTGGALMNGKVAVDLFYSSYAECARHGIRKVDIFVLEEGTGKKA